MLLPSFHNKILKGRTMGKFHDALNQFGQALELPDEFKSAISSAYDDDFSGADSKVTSLETAISEKDAAIEQMRQDYDSQLSAAKAANWDLLRAGNQSAQEDASKPDDRPSVDPSNVSINDLFG